MDIEKLKKLVEYKIVVHEEEIPVEGNASAIDDETDAEIAKNIYEQLENGNIWPWCTVQVIASYNGFSGNDYLGCCSYEDEEDFKKGGYWDDMKSQAFNALAKDIENAKKHIAAIS